MRNVKLLAPAKPTTFVLVLAMTCLTLQAVVAQEQSNRYSQEDISALTDVEEYSTVAVEWVTTDAYEDYCPPQDTIWPCECSGDTTYVSLACYGIVVYDLLDQILAADYPIKEMNLLNVMFSKLGRLEDDILHGNSFEDIDLTGAGITSIAEGTLEGSRDRLIRLMLTSNPLNTLDFSLLPNFPKLESLSVTRTNLSDMESLVGIEPHWKLLYFYLSYNAITELNAAVFQSVPNVTLLDLSHNLLTDIPENLFLPLVNLQELYLYSNNIKHLHTGSLRFSTPILRSLDLRSNELKLVDEDVFMGVTSNPQVDLEDNSLDHFSYDMFGPLLYNISDPPGYIDFWRNRIVCDCDVLWFLAKQDLRDHLIYGKCKNGTRVNNLNIDVLVDQCETNPLSYSLCEDYTSLDVLDYTDY